MALMTSAAASLREGLEETLTVMRLDLPESLERVLSSTNLIENLFSDDTRPGADRPAPALVEVVPQCLASCRRGSDTK